MVLFDTAILQSHEFAVGAAVAAILLGAFFASSLFRNVALALAAAGVVFLYVQGGVPILITLSKTLQTEVLANANFSIGLAVGAAAATMLVLSIRQRAST
jgi:hypothetical protein